MDLRKRLCIIERGEAREGEEQRVKGENRQTKRD